jgi:hypothetical protein
MGSAGEVDWREEIFQKVGIVFLTYHIFRLRQGFSVREKKRRIFYQVLIFLAAFLSVSHTHLYL